mmetsp:Transcript_17225/g.15223  ORF Transcript_17225/g.15223 Transcript_17225/m.15223 type:complete len:160 (+) Transcript_17225:324-803(+)
MKKTKLPKSQDTSCDSQQSPKKRVSRFFHDKHFSFKNRACSTNVSSFKAFGNEGRNLIDLKNEKLPNMCNSLNISKPKGVIAHRKNSLEKEKLQICKIEKDLTSLHLDYKHLCQNLKNSSSKTSRNINDGQLCKLLTQVESKTKELMGMKSYAGRLQTQ